jgi:hypothetical protein
MIEEPREPLVLWEGTSHSQERTVRMFVQNIKASSKLLKV